MPPQGLLREGALLIHHSAPNYGGVHLPFQSFAKVGSQLEREREIIMIISNCSVIQSELHNARIGSKLTKKQNNII